MALRSHSLGWYLCACGATLAVLATGAAVDPPRAEAGCGTVKLGGKLFVFYKQGVSCKKATGLARQTYKRNKAPAGWKCPDSSPGKNRRDGGQCSKVGNPDKYFGYHQGD